MKRMYKIVVKNTSTQEVITTIKKGTQGDAFTELLIFGGVQKDEGADYHNIEWELSITPMPLSKGSLIQMFGRFTNIWSPSIRGIATKA